MDGGGNVLVVGDGEWCRPAHRVLADAGYATQHVSIGHAISLLGQRHWDLVVAGWTADGVDAPSLCRQIRRDPALRSMAVVVASSPAHGDRPTVVLEAGADEYITVPCAPLELLSRVRTVLRARHADRAESRLHALVMNLPGAVYRCDPGSQWTMQYISDQIHDLCGYAPGDLIGDARRSFASIIHPDDREATEAAVNEAVARGEPFIATYRVVCRNGGIRWIRDRGRLVRDDQGRRWLDGVLFDVTAQLDAEQRLRDNLARQAAGEERARIAADLHDSVSQSLFSMSLHARAAQLAVEHSGLDTDGPITTGIAHLHALSQAALAEMRGLIFELRPDALQQEGLAAALRKHVAGVAARDGLDIAVHVPDRVDVDADTAEAVYRVVQEALHNTVKHAGADTIVVSLTCPDASRLEVIVRDDGVGFTPRGHRPGHLGLVTMRERMARVGGHLDVSSSPGAGTTVRGVVPVEQNVSAPRTAST